MSSEVFLPPDARLEQKREKYFRILTLLSVPALGFLSAAVAYLGFFKMESSWPVLVLPPSLLVVGLVLFEGISAWFGHENQPRVPLNILNRIYLITISTFILASTGWLYFLINFIEIHK